MGDAGASSDKVSFRLVTILILENKKVSMTNTSMYYQYHTFMIPYPINLIITVQSDLLLDIKIKDLSRTFKHQIMFSRPFYFY